MVNRILDGLKTPTTLVELGKAVRMAQGNLSILELVDELELVKMTGSNRGFIRISIEGLLSGAVVGGKPRCSSEIASAICKKLEIEMPWSLWGETPPLVIEEKKKSLSPRKTKVPALPKEKKEKLKPKVEPKPTPESLPEIVSEAKNDSKKEEITVVDKAIDPLTIVFRDIFLDALRRVAPEIVEQIAGLLDEKLPRRQIETVVSVDVEALRQQEESFALRESAIVRGQQELNKREEALEQGWTNINGVDSNLNLRKSALGTKEHELKALEESLRQQESSKPVIPSFDGESLVIAGVTIDQAMIDMIVAAATTGLGPDFPPLNNEIQGEFRRELLARRGGKLLAEQNKNQCDKSNDKLESGRLPADKIQPVCNCLLRSVAYILEHNISEMGSIVARKGSNVQSADNVTALNEKFKAQVGRAANWIKLISEYQAADPAGRRKIAQRLLEL